jgi:hypothetical protein
MFSIEKTYSWCSPDLCQDKIWARLPQGVKEYQAFGPGRGWTRYICVPKMILAVEIAIFATAMVQVKSSNDAFEKQISQHKTWQGHVATLGAGWFGFEDLWFMGA